MYEFNTLTGSLTYLPGVGVSPILVSSRDGSRFIFNGPGGLSLWSEEGPEQRHGDADRAVRGRRRSARYT